MARQGALIGVRFLWSEPRALVLTGMAVVSLFSALDAVVMPVFLRDSGRDAADLGSFLALAGGGAIVSALAYARHGQRLGPRRILLASLALETLAFALALQDGDALMLLSGALAGLGVGPLNPLISTALLRGTPAAIRGRVLSAFNALALVATPLAVRLAGAAIELADARRHDLPGRHVRAAGPALPACPAHEAVRAARPLAHQPGILPMTSTSPMSMNAASRRKTLLARHRYSLAAACALALAALAALAPRRDASRRRQSRAVPGARPAGSLLRHQGRRPARHGPSASRERIPALAGDESPSERRCRTSASRRCRQEGAARRRLALAALTALALRAAPAAVAETPSAPRASRGRPGTVPIRIAVSADPWLAGTRSPSARRCGPAHRGGAGRGRRLGARRPAAGDAGNGYSGRAAARAQATLGRARAQVQQQEALNAEAQTQLRRIAPLVPLRLVSAQQIDQQRRRVPARRARRPRRTGARAGVAQAQGTTRRSRAAPTPNPERHRPARAGRVRSR